MMAFKAISAKKKKLELRSKNPLLNCHELLCSVSHLSVSLSSCLFSSCPENFLLVNTTVPLHDGSDVFAAELGINSSRDAHQISDGNARGAWTSIRVWEDKSKPGLERFGGGFFWRWIPIFLLFFVIKQHVDNIWLR